MDESTLPPIMRPDEAAKFLTISTQRLAKLRVEGRGPEFIKAGKSVLYTRASLIAWLEARTRKSTSDHSGHRAAA